MGIVFTNADDTDGTELLALESVFWVLDIITDDSPELAIPGVPNSLLLLLASVIDKTVSFFPVLEPVVEVKEITACGESDEPRVLIFFGVVLLFISFDLELSSVTAVCTSVLSSLF